jgi:hypothetical protein
MHWSRRAASKFTAPVRGLTLHCRLRGEPDCKRHRQSTVAAGETDMKYAFVTCVAGLTVISSAKAADSFYMGTWKFSGAVVAPWADPRQRPDSAEQSRLLGKTVVFKAKEIAGPRPFACSAPHYKVSDFTPDMIFQGAFETMQSNNKSVDPNKIAASLGFLGNSIRTLETGCEIDSFRRRHHRGNRSQRLRIYAKEAVAAISRFCDAMRRAWIRASFAGWISCIRRRSAGCCSLFS